MPKPFKLIKKEFSEKDKEWQWTYELKIVFNEKSIIAITITDYYQKKPGREMITNELILELLERMDGENLRPLKYFGFLKPYKWEITHQGKSYRLYFWFKHGTTNHLWIRNCHRIDKSHEK